MKPERLYAALLRLYPASFREEYEREMRSAFKRRRRDETGGGSRAVLWLSILGDTFKTAWQEHLEMLIQDIRYSLRSLRKTPAFTIATLTALALGVGATTAIYSLVHTVLLRPLPLAEPDRMVRIYETNKPLNIPDFSASVLNFLSWQQQSQSFEALAAIRFGSVNLTGDGDPQRVPGAAVSANFWSMAGIHPLVGRPFSADEDSPGKDRVVILSENLWHQRYGGDMGIIGRSLLVNAEPRTVVGVAPQDVGYTTSVDVWTPLAPNVARENRANHVVTVLGRLRPGIGIDRADSELNAVAESLEQQYPKSNTAWRVRLIPLTDWIIDNDSRRSLYVLLAAVGLLLVAACANVAGLLVTRATARAHEFGVRLALGASRARLVRQLTTESLVLSSIGGALGILFAIGAIRWLATRVTNQLPRSTNLTMDWPVLGFALGLTLVVGLLFGLAPTWTARRSDVMTTLRRAGRGTMRGTGTGLRLALVGGQIAVATMLVVGALLLIKSFDHLQRAPLGFQPDHLLTAGISLPSAKYPTNEKAEIFFRTLLSEVNTLPGVISVGLTSGSPFGGGNTSMAIMPVERQSGVPEEGVQAAWRMTTGEYFRSLQVPLRRGRVFTASDAGQLVTILSENLVRRLWPDGTDPIDREVRIGNGDVLRVIGVVGDVRMQDLRTEPQPAMYFQPFFGSSLTLTIRTAGDPAALGGSLREAVKRVDPLQPLSNLRTMDRILETNAERSRLQTTLLTAFAGLALLLGIVGVAGVVAYTVERRTPELALRLALGATPGQAMRSAARGGLLASLIGVMLGLFGAWGLSQSFATVLYEVQADDPATFAGVAATLLAAAVLACWVPARRAIAIDPTAALKQE